MGCGSSNAAIIGKNESKDKKEYDDINRHDDTKVVEVVTHNNKKETKLEQDKHETKPNSILKKHPDSTSSVNSENADRVHPLHTKSEGAVISRLRSRRSSSMKENLITVRNLDGKSDIRHLYRGVDRKKLLGSGLTSSVRKVVRKSDGKEFALKIIRLDKLQSELVDIIRGEVAVLRMLDHPNIAKLREAYEEPELNLYLVMDLLKGGDLFDRLSKVHHFQEVRAREYVQRMMGAVRYLHEKGICHRDLKLRNFVFADSTPESEIMLIDFGLSQNIENSGERMVDPVGSMLFMAPEIMTEEDYDIKVDLWSMGVIAFTLLVGRPPFFGETDYDVMKKVTRGKYTWPKKANKRVSEEAKKFISKLLVVDPSKRYSAEEALNDAWLSASFGEKLERNAEAGGVRKSSNHSISSNEGSGHRGSRTRRGSLGVDETLARFQKYKNFGALKVSYIYIAFFTDSLIIFNNSFTYLFFRKLLYLL